MMLRKPCEHGLYEPHMFERRPLPGEEFTFNELVAVLGRRDCLGGTEPTMEELVEEVNRRRGTAAPYDIEIPDFVNRHGTVSSE